VEEKMTDKQDTPPAETGRKEIKLYVTHDDGRQDILEIELPLQVLTGQKMWWIRAADRTEHYFTEDSYYDGFGKHA
jgi:hypothetical protein